MKKLVFLSVILMSLSSLLSSCSSNTKTTQFVYDTEEFIGEIDYTTNNSQYGNATLYHAIYKSGKREAIDFYQNINGRTKSIYLAESSKEEIISFFTFLKNFQNNDFIYDTVRFNGDLFYLEKYYETTNEKVKINNITYDGNVILVKQIEKNKEKKINLNKELNKKTFKDNTNYLVLNALDINFMYDYLMDFKNDICNKKITYPIK